MSPEFISSIFSKPKEPKVMAPPTPDQAPVQDAAAKAMRRAALARGRGSTILASGERGAGLGYVGA